MSYFFSKQENTANLDKQSWILVQNKKSSIYQIAMQNVKVYASTTMTKNVIYQKIFIIRVKYII